MTVQFVLHDLIERTRTRRLNHRQRLIEERDQSMDFPFLVEATVDHQAIEPGTEYRFAAEAFQSGEEFQKSVLANILGHRGIAAVPQRDRVDLILMALEQGAKSVGVAALTPFYKLDIEFFARFFQHHRHVWFLHRIRRAIARFLPDFSWTPKCKGYRGIVDTGNCLRNCRSIAAAAAPAALVVWGAHGVIFGAGVEVNTEQNRVIEGMIREQATRFEHFESFSRLQHYSVTTDRFGLKAEMVARMHRDRIKGKSYEVISRSGSSVIQNRVFDPLLEAEVETSRQSAELLTRENYTFRLTGQQEFEGHTCYVLETEPKRKDKRLLRGRIWVDTEDFGVIHVEGRPSDSLSLWVGKPMIVQEFAKISGYWWASRRHSYIDNFFLGKSDLVIDYSDYQFQLRRGEETAGTPAR
jgi:hypothetical protein